MERARRKLKTFGNLAFVAFMLTQCFDGVFTYVGVVVWGLAAEANPVVGRMMSVMGAGFGLMLGKLVAVGFGILLHLLQLHQVVALLAVLYLLIAVLPWAYLFLVF